MALIPCPECGRRISDQAVSCPGCGRPLNPVESAAPPLPATGAANGEILDLIRRHQKIAAIKRFRELHPGMGLAEARDAVERIEKGLPPEIRALQRKSGCLSMLLIALLGGALTAAVVAAAQNLVSRWVP